MMATEIESPGSTGVVSSTLSLREAKALAREVWDEMNLGFRSTPEPRRWGELLRRADEVALKINLGYRAAVDFNPWVGLNQAFVQLNSAFQSGHRSSVIRVLRSWKSVIE